MTELEYRSLGRSGLRVSAVGLGGNNFGRPGTATETQEGTNAVVAAALDAGVNFIDTADIYGREYGLSETLLGEALRGRRDEVVIATKFGHASLPSPLPAWGARGSRRYIRLAVEGLAAAPADRLDRPLPAPHARPRDADRRDDRGARRARARGQGALHRPLEPQRLADRRGGARRARARRDAIRLRAERVQPPLARGRGRGAASRASLRARLPAVLPAAERPAHRQVPPRRAAGRHPHHAPAAPPRRRRARGMCSTAIAPSRRRAASRCSRRPSAGCSRSRPWRA